MACVVFVLDVYRNPGLDIPPSGGHSPTEGVNRYTSAATSRDLASGTDRTRHPRRPIMIIETCRQVAGCRATQVSRIGQSRFWQACLAEELFGEREHVSATPRRSRSGSGYKDGYRYLSILDSRHQEGP